MDVVAIVLASAFVWRNLEPQMRLVFPNSTRACATHMAVETIVLRNETHLKEMRNV